MNWRIKKLLKKSIPFIGQRLRVLLILKQNEEKGIYVCAACKTALYDALHKFDSKSGWPSFDRAIKGSVELDVDYKIGYARTELKCNTCGGHLGHSFDDGPKETTGKRHCINGVALEFVSEKKQP